jgi:hypothetical protein
MPRAKQAVATAPKKTKKTAPLEGAVTKAKKTKKAAAPPATPATKKGQELARKATKQAVAQKKKKAAAAAAPAASAPSSPSLPRSMGPLGRAASEYTRTVLGVQRMSDVAWRILTKVYLDSLRKYHDKALQIMMVRRAKTMQDTHVRLGAELLGVYVVGPIPPAKTRAKKAATAEEGEAPVAADA